MNAPRPAAPVLVATTVQKYYPHKAAGWNRKQRYVKAVEDISLEVNRGEVFGLVGESGCGKSTLGRTLLYFETPTEGEVLFKGQRVGDFSAPQLKAFRRSAQMIYQDPYSALNPRKAIGALIEEPLTIHAIGDRAARRERVAGLLEKVGLLPEHAVRYPHQFSGGQRQRIVIARALALNPELILADEPVSALDVSIQAQMINLLMDLGAEFGLTYIFISHDLSVVQHICDRLAVMYLGRFVELAPKTEFYRQPLHPYAKALLDAAPVPDPTLKRAKLILQGDVPSPIDPPTGCAFHPRCPYVQNRCRGERPDLREVAAGRQAACHYPLL
jgi:oligopeptide/dipeptide ABC transporter ATP-binding protein